VCFFIFMFLMAIHQLFPNLFLSVGAIVLFLLIFSPETLRCCGRKTVKKNIKRQQPSAPYEDMESNNKIDEEPMTVSQIPFIEEKDLLIKGYINVISLNERVAKQFLVLSPRYRKDPLTFYRGVSSSPKDDADQGYDVLAISKAGERWSGLSLPPLIQNSVNSRNNRELIDIWLLKLLGGEVPWIVTSEESIPLSSKPEKMTLRSSPKK
jgi:hypothetical protein